MDKEKILNQYYELVRVDSVAARMEILKLPFSKDAYLLSRIALTYRDEGMFFKNGKTKKKYVTEKLEIARKYIERAYKLAPSCRDVLYVRGTIYMSLDENIKAKDCFIKIIKYGEKKGKRYNCSESNLPFTNMIVNDAYFQLYRLFFDSGSYTLANKLLKKYKEGLREGLDTIYVPLKEFLKKKNVVEKNKKSVRK